MGQLTLNFEPGIAAKYRDLRECFAACVYQRGLGRVAAAVDQQPSNLSAMLSGERNLDVGIVERYMAEFADTEPALYLAAKYLQDASIRQQQALARLPSLVDELTRLMATAGRP